MMTTKDQIELFQMFNNSITRTHTTVLQPFNSISILSNILHA